MVLAVVLLALVIVRFSDRSAPGDGPDAKGAASPTTEPRLARDLVPYTGLGTWIDVFDYAPAYQANGADPPLSVADLEDMSRHGVRTVFLQAARWDDKSPNGIVDRALVGDYLQRAHQLGMRVVGWYLPRFGDIDLDVTRAMQIQDFRSGDERFDGLAIDIEYTEAVADTALRNEALVRFSRALRGRAPDAPVAAVVLSPVHLEVINPTLWPSFPYAELRELYDVWMPMAYWTLRVDPYGDGYRYVRESVDRLRADLGGAPVVVAPIGGISDEMTETQIAEFGGALRDIGAIGGSFYDWATMAPGKQAAVQQLFAKGAASALPAPPLFAPGRQRIDTESVPSGGETITTG
jgi:hypothetical protein